MTDKKKTTEPAMDKSRDIRVVCKEGEDPQLASARVLFGPHVMNGNVAAYFAKVQVGEIFALAPLIAALEESSKRINSNDMTGVEATLISQATALNVIFGELSRRAALNMSEYLEASERYLRMALKAQNQCRMTLETLSNIKNPPVVYAKQANIANGPQQVNNGSMPRAHADERKSPPNKVLDGQEPELQGLGQSEPAAGAPAVETVGTTDDSRMSEVKAWNIAPRFKARPVVFVPSKKRFVPSKKRFVPSKKRFVPPKRPFIAES